MTKEEFIAIAQQSSDRVDMLSKMGKEFSVENITTYIKTPRQAFGMTVSELFDNFSQPAMSKEQYLSHLSGSKNRIDLIEKMGYPVSIESFVKYVIDPGRKFEITLPDMKMIWDRNSATGSSA